MNELATPDAVTAATAVGSGLLGAGVGQSTLPRNTSRRERGFHFFGSWACAILFGPMLTRKLGMDGDATTLAAVCGACSIFGLVLVERTVRYIRASTSLLDLLARVAQVVKEWGSGK